MLESSEHPFQRAGAFQVAGDPRRQGRRGRPAPRLGQPMHRVDRPQAADLVSCQSPSVDDLGGIGRLGLG